MNEKYELLNESIYVLVKLKEKKLSHLDIKPCNIGEATAIGESIGNLTLLTYL